MTNHIHIPAQQLGILAASAASQHAQRLGACDTHPDSRRPLDMVPISPSNHQLGAQLLHHASEVALLEQVQRRCETG